MKTPILTLALLLTGCGDKDDTATPAGGDDTADDTAAAETVLVFPSGSTTWTGTAELSGFGLSASLDVTRTGSLLEGTTSFELSGTQMGIDLLGTIDDQSGQFVLVPTGWSGEAPEGLGLVGLSGTYDPETGALSGFVRDTQSWDSNSVDGGAFSATTTAAPGEVTLASITADHAISTTDVAFSGTFWCTSDPRPGELVLVRGSDGQLTGTLSFDESDGTYVGTFGVVGAEDATTGAITLAPTPWIEEESKEYNYGNFFVHGILDGGSYIGNTYNSSGIACPEDSFQMTAE